MEQPVAIGPPRQALVNRKLAHSGGDPLAEKRRTAGVPTFAEAAERVLEQKRGGWRGRWHAHNWMSSMERYAFPRISRRPVSEVNTADVLEILCRSGTPRRRLLMDDWSESLARNSQ